MDAGFIRIHSPLPTAMPSLSVPDDIYGSLKNLFYLEGIPDEIIREIAKNVERQELPANKVVYDKGDRGDAMYFIMEGEVAVLKEGRIINSLGKGNCFGEFALIDNSKRIATIETSEATVLYRIGADTFTKILMKQSSFRMKLLEEFATRIRNSNEGIQLSSGEVSEMISTRAVSKDNLRKFSKPTKQMHAEIIKTLTGKDDIFESIDPTEIVKISTVGRLEKNQPLFNKGEPCDAAYVVLTGEVSIRTGTEGTQQQITLFKEGKAFGFMSMFGNHTRSASAVTGPNGAQLLKIDKNKFLNLLKNNEEYCIALLKLFLRRLQEANKKQNFDSISVGKANVTSPKRIVSLIEFFKKKNLDEGIFFKVTMFLDTNSSNSIGDIKIKDAFRSIAEGLRVIPEKIIINRIQFWPLPTTKNKFWSIKNINAVKNGKNDFLPLFFVRLIKAICDEGLDDKITEEEITNDVQLLFAAFKEADENSVQYFQKTAKRDIFVPLKLWSIGCFSHPDYMMRNDLFPDFYKDGYKTKRIGKSSFFYINIDDKDTYKTMVKHSYQTTKVSPLTLLSKEVIEIVCDYPTIWQITKDKSGGFNGVLFNSEPIKIYPKTTEKEKKYLKSCVDKIKNK